MLMVFQYGIVDNNNVAKVNTNDHIEDPDSIINNTKNVPIPVQDIKSNNNSDNSTNAEDSTNCANNDDVDSNNYDNVVVVVGTSSVLTINEELLESLIP